MSETKTPITLELGIPEPAAVDPVIEPTEIAEAAAPAAEPIAPVPTVLANIAYETVELTEEEQKIVDEFSEKIDLKDSAIVLQYGAACQKKIAEFSDTALEGVRTKDLGAPGDMIADLVVELKGFSAKDEAKGLFGFFQKAGSEMTRLKARYDRAEVNVDRIVGVLEDHQNQLLKDIVMLDKMYDTNLTYFKELTMYIMAGKKKLDLERATTLPEMMAHAEQSGQAQDAQAANDFAAMCDRFEKKLHDLELTRTISIQMAPQIRLVQNSNTLMVERIQSTVANTIPLWKSQMVLALGMANSQAAMQAQKEVNDLTNELLKQNADTLKQGVIDIATESERSIVDIESVKYTNEQLISTLDEVLRIQDEGRAKRRAAEAELGRIETELREKLLEIHN